MNKNKSKKISGGQAAVLSLKKEKTKHVFGLIGSATMEMFDALYKEKTINFIGVRDERTGAHMADGYARASNKPGVVLAGQNGPGATNLVTSVANCFYESIPCIFISVIAKGLAKTKYLVISIENNDIIMQYINLFIYFIYQFSNYFYF